jgi:nucleotide-binding universal stress UspA family protein
LVGKAESIRIRSLPWPKTGEIKMQRFKNILCYVGTEQSETAINRSLALALENDAALTIIDVVKPAPRAFGIGKDDAERSDLERMVARSRRRELLDQASEYSDTGVSMEVVVSSGDPACEIVREVLRGGHDLVVKTTEESSHRSRSVSGVASSLLRLCPCPVWLLKPEVHGAFDRVLAAIDAVAESPKHVELNRNILDLAESVARREDAELHIVSAWDFWMESSIRRHAGNEQTDQALAEHEAKVTAALEQLLPPREDRDPKIHVHLRRGHAAEVIRLVADRVEADLMVMGTVCRTGVAGFLIGSTAEALLPDVTCSILAIKPDGFQTPVIQTPAIIDRGGG